MARRRVKQTEIWSLRAPVHTEGIYTSLGLEHMWRSFGGNLVHFPKTRLIRAGCIDQTERQFDPWGVEKTGAYAYGYFWVRTYQGHFGGYVLQNWVVARKRPFVEWMRMIFVPRGHMRFKDVYVDLEHAKIILGSFGAYLVLAKQAIISKWMGIWALRAYEIWTWGLLILNMSGHLGQSVHFSEHWVFEDVLLYR